MSEDLLITVDPRDQALEPRGKHDCHEGDGVLHRAFSVYLFDAQRRLLVQQRSEAKPLWPGHWANSCCSHPRWGEETLHAAERRVTEELGLQAALKPVFSFRYQARFGGQGSEHELCHVLIGSVHGSVNPDPEEVADFAFMEPARLDAELEESPNHYTPWLHIAWKTLRSDHWDQIEKL